MTHLCYPTNVRKMASPQSLADIPQMDCGLTLLHAADDECTAVGSVDQGFSGSGKHFASVTLEVFHPQSDALVGRWDFELYYGTARDGAMWVNTEDIKYHVLKAGRWPSSCDYRVIFSTNPAEPSVAGWSNTTFRSTAGFVRASEPPSTATAT